MPAPSGDQSDVTRMLLEASDDPDAAQRVLPAVYNELRAAAAARMASERSDHTLQATALVHEAYAKLAVGRDIPWANRRHFYTAAAEAMRQILIDHARSKGRQKRGGDRTRTPMDLGEIADSWNLEETLSLDDALRRLSDESPEIAEVVRLRFFAGLSIAQVADAMGISPATVKRRWEFGRTWLYRDLRQDGPDDRTAER